MFYQVKLLKFYNVETTNLTFIEIYKKINVALHFQTVYDTKYNI